MLFNRSLGRMLAFDFGIPAWMPMSDVLPLPKPRWKLLARRQAAKQEEASNQITFTATSLLEAECKKGLRLNPNNPYTSSLEVS